jgi:putative transport protein
MDWLQGLFFSGHGVANGVVAICLVAIVGLAVGEIKIGVVKLGIAGPLFVGIAFGHFGLKMDHEILEFARDFGLILFVYAIGITVGPSFLEAFKKEGVLLNALAAFIVIAGGVIAVGIHFGFGLPLDVVVGLFSGGTTNTPSLAAGMEMLKEMKATAEQVGIPGQAYAVAYPFGIIGILLTMGLVRMFFRVTVPAEADRWQASIGTNQSPIETMTIDVRNPKIVGNAIGELPLLRNRDVIVSRYMRAGTQYAARMEDTICVGDTVLAVGPRPKLEEFCNSLGAEASVRLQEVHSTIKARRLLVTRANVLGKSIGALATGGITVTRLTRGNGELTPDRAVKLQFGDQLMCVGDDDKLNAFAKILGNDPKALQHTQMIPIFLGIFLGCILGSVPLFIPGLPAPIKLGLAGGPVVIAIILSRIGHIGPLVWHVPQATTNAIREIGITMFMCCVGLYAGHSFINTLIHGDGLKWMACATLITAIPLLITGFAARGIFKLNYLTICGVLAGSMTDPPALAFANAIHPSDAQATAYATVYPLTMCLRILTPQIILAALWVAS